MNLNERNLKILADVQKEHALRLEGLTKRLDAMNGTIIMLTETVRRLEAEKLAAFAASRGNGSTSRE